MNNNNATILNINGNINDLDNLSLIRELENRRPSSILLCSGNCNCLNHLRQSITEHNSIIDDNNRESNQINQFPESSSIATTSTLNSSNLNTSTTFTTTIIDEIPTNTNLNLVVETNLTTFSTLPSNHHCESTQRTDHRQKTIKNQPDQQILNVGNLETLRNNQLNRSSTFNDLQSCLKNFYSR